MSMFTVDLTGHMKPIPSGWVMSKDAATLAGVSNATISKWADAWKIEAEFIYDPKTKRSPRWINPDTLPDSSAQQVARHYQDALITCEEYDHLAGYGIPHEEVVRRLAVRLRVTERTVCNHLDFIQGKEVSA